MGRFVFAGPHRALLVDFAPEAVRETGLLPLPRGEEHRVARERLARRKDDTFQPGVPFQADDAIVTDANAVAIESRAIVRAELGRAVGAEHQVAAPGGQLERETEPTVAAAVDRQRLVAQLPSVAVRTMEHAAAVQLAEPGTLGEVVDHSGGNQELARVVLSTVLERDVEGPVAAFGRDHAPVA